MRCCGRPGPISGGGAPKIVVDASTISVEASQQVRERLAVHGTDLLAAPVMGNPKVASVVRLTLAVSGPAPRSTPPSPTWICSAPARPT